MFLLETVIWFLQNIKRYITFIPSIGIIDQICYFKILFFKTNLFKTDFESATNITHLKLQIYGNMIPLLKYQSVLNTFWNFIKNQTFFKSGKAKMHWKPKHYNIWKIVEIKKRHGIIAAWIFFVICKVFLWVKNNLKTEARWSWWIWSFYSSTPV